MEAGGPAASLRLALAVTLTPLVKTGPSRVTVTSGVRPRRSSRQGGGFCGSNSSSNDRGSSGRVPRPDQTQQIRKEPRIGELRRKNQSQISQITTQHDHRQDRQQRSCNDGVQGPKWYFPIAVDIACSRARVEATIATRRKCQDSSFAAEGTKRWAAVGKQRTKHMLFCARFDTHLY